MNMKQFKGTPLLKSRSWWMFVWVAVGILAIAPISFYIVSNFSATSLKGSSAPTAKVSTIKAVTSLGRLEPQGEVIYLSAPASAEGTRIAQLSVKEGDWVKAGQTVAILDSRDSRQAALIEAQQNVALARAKRAQVQAGEAKVAGLAAQKANIARLEAQLRTETTARAAEVARAQAELRNAESTYRRSQLLHQEGAISTSARDDKREAFETAQAKLNVAEAQWANTVSTVQKQIQQERSMLNKLKEVRPVDVQAAQAEVNSALASVKKAQANLDLAYVRASRDGQILKIHTWPGETIGNRGIVELGKTNQMYVVAEVYQTDIQKVRLGQRAAITSDAFFGTVQGTVDQIGLQIFKRDVLSTDPLADTDARVVEVKVRLDPTGSQKVAGLTNVQVNVLINP
jgi:HlyD family secretion protein